MLITRRILPSPQVSLTSSEVVCQGSASSFVMASSAFTKSYLNSPGKDLREVSGVCLHDYPSKYGSPTQKRLMSFTRALNIPVMRLKIIGALWFRPFLLHYLSHCPPCEGAKRSEAAGEACVSGYCLTPNYSPLELPQNTTNVAMNLEILDVLRVDDKKFSVTLSMYFGVYWTEDRLVARRSDFNPEWLPINMDFMRHLWIPNVFVYNLVSFDALACLKKLAGLWIVRDKELFYNQATHVTFMCPMRFNKFPLDEHTCKFMVGSTNFDVTRMTFVNKKLDYDPSARNTILDYQVSIGPLKDADRILAYGDAGNYSITGFEMKMTRNVAKYLYIYYLPSGLFVVVSWSSFLIPPEVVPGRMALLVTLFLVLINIFNTITNLSPNVEGMTAISSWMIACVLFVSAALTGYAALLYYLLVQKKKTFAQKRLNMSSPHAQYCMLHPSSEAIKQKNEVKQLDQQELLARVDSFFLAGFPLAFIIFNIIYWPYWITS